MPAYFVANVQVIDREKFKAYQEGILKTIKLFKGWILAAEPGAILRGDQCEFCRAWPNQKEVSVKGIHFIQEDSPDEIGQALADWISTLI
jgi:hypothetical protein